MIIGTGSDLVNIKRIEEVMQRFGARFTEKYFTPAEREKAGGRPESYAKRFAAKEACSKALGTGIAQGVHLKDIGVVNDAAGKPGLMLTGGAKARLESLVPPGMKAVIHLSLADDPPLAKADVIIEAL
ncbi:MAG: holo-ACP synthase [Alphaproteobacteria bacterium]|nr:holo-ACP synthase [Alphaproteobacteria bacterium]